MATYTLSEKQRKTTPSITADGKTLSYRHPWVLASDGNGIVRRVGCSTLDDAPIFATVYTAENKVTGTKSSLRIFDEAGVSKIRRDTSIYSYNRFQR